MDDATLDDATLEDLLASQLGRGDPLIGRKPSARILRRTAKRRYLAATRQEALAAILPDPPAPGESIHLICNGAWDFATWIPHIIRWHGRVDSLYVSTWIVARPHILDIFAEHDAGRIRAGQIAFLTGLYFKQRATHNYALLLAGLRDRGARFKAFPNHSKVLLLANARAGAWYSIETSANLNSNSRLEQYVLTNDRALWRFHREWFDWVLDSKAPPDKRAAKRAP